MLISVLLCMGNKTIKVGPDCLTYAYSYDDGIFVACRPIAFVWFLEV